MSNTPKSREERPGPRRRPSRDPEIRSARSELPVWIVEALRRVTPAADADRALAALERASIALNEGRFRDALDEARAAKRHSARDATIREVIGIAGYRLGVWEEALRELRTFRRLAGDDTHMPAELDILRALRRWDSLDRAWEEVLERVDDPEVRAESLLVYASHLLDQNRVNDAIEILADVRITPDPDVWEVRLWHVAARACAGAGDRDAACSFRDAIVEFDPGAPGLDDLDSLVGPT